MTNLVDSLHALRSAYQQQPYPDLTLRKSRLLALRQSLLKYQQALYQATATDFGQRSVSETRLLEIMPSIATIDYTLKQLKRWLKPQRRHVSWLFYPAKNFVLYQPLGVIGIIVPWNYPIFLSLGPLITAISAGNKAMLKLSEFTPHTNQVLKALIAEALPDCVQVIEGDAQVAADFSQLPFDHLLYTGSTAVGYHVMKAASANLTPVTLELGGKSPLLIAEDASITRTAARLLFGKTANAGQTCVAPDYVLVPRQLMPKLISALQQQFQQFYSSEHAEQYTSVINDRHHVRLQSYLDEAIARGAQVIQCAGADWPATPRCMPLQLVLDAPLDCQLWQQEIFGPLLPLLPYDSLSEALDFINARPRPLALYLFSDDRKVQQQVLQQTHAGGVCLNETLLHVGQDDLPFGGIGPSGMGNYHGREGFVTLSHAKAVHQKGRFSSALLAYPQHRAKLLDKLLGFLLKSAPRD